MHLPIYLIVTLQLVLAWVVIAAGPPDCSGSKQLSGSDFTLKESADNAHLAALAKIFKAKKKNTTVSDVLASGNHKLTSATSWPFSNPVASAKLWECTSDFDDEGTEKWVPQGITSTADALGVGTYEGKDAWVVSWHNPDNSRVRVTFIDRSTMKYRHVFLVNPTADDDFEAVAVHAGGIVWYGNTLWVVDSSNGAVGFRVFDLDNIWEVDSGDAVGKNGDTYSAADYKYVLPQIRSYSWIPTDYRLQFSFVSLDRTDTPDSLMVGEYHTQDETDPRRFVQWDLDYTTRKLKTTNGVASASWAYCVNIDHMQGAIAANGKFYISRSNGAGEGDMFGWVPGNSAIENSNFFPPGPEDLSYDGRTDEIYGLTEKENGRYILTYKASKVNF